MHRAHSLSTHSHSRLAMLLAMVIATTCAAFLVSSRVLAVPGDDRVLILDTTVSGGLSSSEAQAAIDLGFGVDVVDAAAWASSRRRTSARTGRSSSATRRAGTPLRGTSTRPSRTQMSGARRSTAT